MKIGKLGSLALGLATFVSSQNLRAQEPSPPIVQESTISLESKKAEHKTRLKELASLPEIRADEIARGLAEIGKSYVDNDVSNNWPILRELIIDSKNELVQIFQGSLKLLSSEDSKKQKGGREHKPT